MADYENAKVILFKQIINAKVTATLSSTKSQPLLNIYINLRQESISQ